MTVATFTPQRDATIDGSNPTVKAGSSSSLEVGKVYLAGSKAFLRRIVINFDVSALIGAYASIDAAQLELSVYAAGGTDEVAAWVERCTRPADWTEAGVTWQKYDGSNNWTAGGGDMDASTPARVAYDIPTSAGLLTITGLLAFVTDAIASRANIVALILHKDDESDDGNGRNMIAWSKEGTTAPVLRVTYTPLGGAGGWNRRGGWP